jgi:hypothetical protein
MERLKSLDPQVIDGRFGTIPFTIDLSEMHSKRLKFWVRELFELCEQQHRVSLTLGEARQLYTRENGAVPLCLGRVFVELVRNKTLTRLEDYEKRRSMVGTLVSAVLSPFRWAMSSERLEDEPELDEVFVFSDLVERAGQEVLSKLEGSCFSEEDASDCVKKVVAFERDCGLVMNWLMQRGGLVEPIESGSGKKLVKRTNAQVTELDVIIYELRKSMERLKQQEDELSDQIRLLREEARKAVVEDKNKIKALALLRRKKIAEDALNKRLEMGTNVALVLSRVEGAQATQEAMAALQMGNEALKSSNVQVERVEELLDEFAALQEEQERVGDTIANVGKNEFDMDELEKELEALNLKQEDVNLKGQEVLSLKGQEDVLLLPQAPTRVVVAAEREEDKVTAKKKLILE